MLQDQASLLEGHTWKKVGEFTDGDAVLEVLDQRRHWYARTTKHPRSAHAILVTLYRFAG